MLNKIRPLILFLCCAIACKSELTKDNLSAEEPTSSKELPKQIEKITALENAKRWTELKKFESEKEKSEFDILEIVEKDRKGFDYTKPILRMLEETNCVWNFHAVNSQNKKYLKYYLDKYYDVDFIYCRIDKDAKKTDYTKLRTNTLLRSTEGNMRYLADKIKFMPLKGKKPFVFHKPTYLFAHKHLGVRNGCIMRIEFSEDLGGQLFRGKAQDFQVEKVLYHAQDSSVYLTLQNHKNGDAFCLRSHKYDSLAFKELESNPEFIPESHFDKPKNPSVALKNTKPLSIFKKNLYHAASIGELVLAGGVIVGVGAFYLSELLDEPPTFSGSVEDYDVFIRDIINYYDLETHNILSIKDYTENSIRLTNDWEFTFSHNSNPIDIQNKVPRGIKIGENTYKIAELEIFEENYVKVSDATANYRIYFSGEKAGLITEDSDNLKIRYVLRDKMVYDLIDELDRNPSYSLDYNSDINNYNAYAYATYKRLGLDGAYVAINPFTSGHGNGRYVHILDNYWKFHYATADPLSGGGHPIEITLPGGRPQKIAALTVQGDYLKARDITGGYLRVYFRGAKAGWVTGDYDNADIHFIFADKDAYNLIYEAGGLPTFSGDYNSEMNQYATYATGVSNRLNLDDTKKLTITSRGPEAGKYVHTLSNDWKFHYATAAPLSQDDYPIEITLPGGRPQKIAELAVEGDYLKVPDGSGSFHRVYFKGAKAGWVTADNDDADLQFIFADQDAYNLIDEVGRIPNYHLDYNSDINNYDAYANTTSNRLNLEGDKKVTINHSASGHKDGRYVHTLSNDWKFHYATAAPLSEDDYPIEITLPGGRPQKIATLAVEGDYLKVPDGSGSYHRVYFKGAKAGWVTADNDDADLQFIFADQDAYNLIDEVGRIPNYHLDYNSDINNYDAYANTTSNRLNLEGDKKVTINHSASGHKDGRYVHTLSNDWKFHYATAAPLSEDDYPIEITLPGGRPQKIATLAVEGDYLKVPDGSGSYHRVYFRGAKAGWVTADSDDAGLQFIFADQDAYNLIDEVNRIPNYHLDYNSNIRYYNTYITGVSNRLNLEGDKKVTINHSASGYKDDRNVHTLSNGWEFHYGRLIGIMPDFIGLSGRPLPRSYAQYLDLAIDDHPIEISIGEGRKYTIATLAIEGDYLKVPDGSGSFHRVYFKGAKAGWVTADSEDAGLQFIFANKEAYNLIDKVDRTPNYHIDYDSDIDDYNTYVTGVSNRLNLEVDKKVTINLSASGNEDGKYVHTLSNDWKFHYATAAPLSEDDYPIEITLPGGRPQKIATLAVEGDYLKVPDGSGSYHRVYFRGAKAGWVTADNDDADLQFIFADKDAYNLIDEAGGLPTFSGDYNSDIKDYSTYATGVSNRLDLQNTKKITITSRQPGAGKYVHILSNTWKFHYATADPLSGGAHLIEITLPFVYQTQKIAELAIEGDYFKFPDGSGSYHRVYFRGAKAGWVTNDADNQTLRFIFADQDAFRAIHLSGLKRLKLIN